MSHLYGPAIGMRRTDVSRRRLLTNAAGITIGVPLGTGALAACSGNDDGFAEPGTEEKPGKGSTEKVERFSGTLTIGTLSNPPDEVKTALEAAYRKSQPDVQFVWETQNLGPEEYETWLGTQLAASEVRLDLVSGNYAPTFDGYVNLDQYRTAANPYTGHPWDEDLNFDVAVGRNPAGERIRLATQTALINWYYNVDLFAEVGVEAPADWDQFVAVCEQLDAAGVTPVSTAWTWQFGSQLASLYFDAYHTHWVETVRAREGDYNYDPEQDEPFDPNNPDLHASYVFNRSRFMAGLRDGELRYDTDEMTELITQLTRIYPRFAPGDFFTSSDPYAPFVRRNTAMMFNGQWALNSLNNDMAEMSDERLEELGLKPGEFETFEWGVFNHPPMTTPSVKAEHMRSVESGTGEYVSVIDKGGEQTRMALDFAMFWLSAPGHQAYLDALEEAGELVTGEILISGLELPPATAELREGVESQGQGIAAYTTYWYDGGSGDFATDKASMLQAALEGDLTPEEYGAELQKYHEDNLDGLLEYHQLTHDDLDHPERQPEAA